MIPHITSGKGGGMIPHQNKPYLGQKTQGEKPQGGKKRSIPPIVIIQR